MALYFTHLVDQSTAVPHLYCNFFVLHPLDKALEFYGKAMKEYERSGVTGLNLGSTYNNIGLVYSDKGDLDKALEFYGKAMKEYERSGVTGLNIGATYTNFGEAFTKKGDLPIAFDYLEKARKEFDSAEVKGGNRGELHNNTRIIIPGKRII